MANVGRKDEASLNSNNRRHRAAEAHASAPAPAAPAAVRAETHSSTARPQPGTGRQQQEPVGTGSVHLDQAKVYAQKSKGYADTYENFGTDKNRLREIGGEPDAEAVRTRKSTAAIDEQLRQRGFKVPKTQVKTVEQIKADRERIHAKLKKNLAMGAMKTALLDMANRNKEFAELNKHALTSNVDTKRDGAVFWSGHSYEEDYKGSKTKIDGMRSAHQYAKETGKKALEQTEGGLQMEEHGGEYGRVAKRFAYLNAMKGGGKDEEQESKERFAGHRQRLLEQHLGDDYLGGLSKENRENIGKSSPAGGIWNQLSKRFAAAASGEVTVVHGVAHDEFYGPTGEGSDFGKNSVWMKQERPQLLEKDDITGIRTITTDRTDMADVSHGALSNERTVEHNPSGDRQFYRSSDRKRNFGPERPQRKPPHAQ